MATTSCSFVTLLLIEAASPRRRAPARRASPRRRRAVADPVGALSADVLVVLVEVPQSCRPVTQEHHVGDERPVFLLDLVPEFGGQPRSGDGACVPTPGRLVEGVLRSALRRFYE